MKKSLLLAVASLAVISCSKRPIDNPVDPIGQEPGAVRFSTTGIATVESKVTSDATGSKFDAGDIIGIFAVLDGKKLNATGAFPTSGSVYRDKKYKAGTPETGSPYKAPFTPNAAAETIYYLPGGQAYNYYAYYPTTTIATAALGVSSTMNATAYATAAWQLTTAAEDPTAATAFTKQDDLSTKSGYPGPMMYAYYNTPDKATKLDGSENTDPVNLQFKYANAKLSLEFQVDETIKKAANIDQVQLYATSGLYGNYTFDLKNASESQATKPVMTSRTDLLLNGFDEANSRYNAYSFENIPDGSDEKKSTVTGYLIPATTVEGAVIRITTKKDDGTSTGEAFLAELDRTSLDEGKNFLEKVEPGKEYKFIIKLSKKGVEFTGQIVDWVAAATDTPEISVF